MKGTTVVIPDVGDVVAGIGGDLAAEDKLAQFVPVLLEFAGWRVDHLEEDRGAAAANVVVGGASVGPVLKEGEERAKRGSQKRAVREKLMVARENRQG